MSSVSSSESINWQAALSQTYSEVFQISQQVLPQLLMAAMLLIFGLLVAFVLRFAVQRLIFGFDWLFKLLLREDSGDPEALRSSYARVAGRIVYWIVLVLFITASTRVLGWSLFSGWLEGFVDYLPRLLTGLAIILAAFLFGGLVRNTVTRALSSINTENSDALGRVAQVIILVAATMIGVEQLGLDVSFLSTLLIVIVGVLLLGMALAFALGAKNFVANMIAAQAVQRQCRVGDYLQIGELSGLIAEVTQTSVIIDGKQGRITVPAKLLMEQVSLLSSEDPSTGSASLLGGLFNRKNNNDES